MKENVTYALIHSPLVGPFTWKLVYEALVSEGLKAIIPALFDNPRSSLPYWHQHVESVAQGLAQTPKNQSIVLVAHSGAGPLLPALRDRLPHTICAYVFVDAGIPQEGLSRIDLMRLEDPQWADEFHKALLKGEQFPTWTEDDLREVIPNDDTRRNLHAEIRPRALSFFTEPIPVFAGWPEAPCVYIKFSQSYNWDAEEAKRADWLVYELNAGHFHMLVQPLTVAELLVESTQRILDASGLK
ncbi:MAG TPA: alpha/beta fold hydrolase [Anaerolineales bacterium]|nr:alpha/beta fold hydrolase [Anaerolineales bacterium]